MVGRGLGSSEWLVGKNNGPAGNYGSDTPTSLGGTLSVLLGAAISAFAVIHVLPKYTAKALILVGDAAKDTGERADDSAMDTWVALLSSDAQLQRVFEAVKAVPRLRSEISRLRDLQRAAKSMQELKSHLIGISFTAKSAQSAADGANLVADVFIRNVFDQGRQAARQAEAQIAVRTTQLTEQIRSLQSEIERRRGQELGPSVLDGLQSQLAALRGSLDSATLQGAMLKRQREERAQREVLSPPVSLFASATPPNRRGSPHPLLVIIPCLIASLIWGLAMVLLLGRLDPKIRDESDVLRRLQARCIAVLPRLPRSRNGPASRKHFGSGPTHGYDHAVRSAVAALLLRGGQLPKSIAFTSCERAKDVTTLAMSFSAQLARLRLSVLMIEFDHDAGESRWSGRPISREFSMSWKAVPRLERRFNATSRTGLTSCRRGRPAEMRSRVWQPTNSIRF